MNEYPWTAAFHFAGYDLGGCAATLVWLHFLSIYLSLLLVLLIVHDFRVWFHRCVVTLVILVQFSLCMFLFLDCPVFFYVLKNHKDSQEFVQIVSALFRWNCQYLCRSCSDG